MQRIYADTVQTPTGDVLAGASVYVYNTGTFASANIYADDGITPISQPLITDGNGQFTAYAANGRYDIRVIKAGYTDTWYRDVILEDPHQGTNSGQDSSGALVTPVGGSPTPLSSIAGNIVTAYPSATPGNSHCDLVVPNHGAFVDNVMTVRNLSDNGVIHGNAAFRFCDSVLGIERAAIGYSRVNTGTPGGFYPNLLYCECGNLAPGDPDDTDFSVVVTHVPGATHFPGTSLKAIEVVSSTGGVNVRTQGGAIIHLMGPTVIANDLAVGNIAGAIYGASVAGSNTAMRWREHQTANQFAFTTNISNPNAVAPYTQDDNTKSSWLVSYGAGFDNFKIGRIAAGSASDWTSLFSIDNIGNATLGGIGRSPYLSVSATAITAKIREYEVLNQFALTTNIANPGSSVITGNQDDATKASWKLSIGSGNDNCVIGRVAGGGAAWTNMVTVDNAGRMMVGQSATAAGADGTIAVTSIAGASGATLRTTGVAYPLICYNTPTTGNNLFAAFGTEATYTQRGDITYNRAGGLVAYNTSSDYRLKDIFGPVIGAIEKVSALKPVMGRIHGATLTREMFVAHELQGIAPYAVTGEKDAVDSDGNPVYQTVDASTLIPLLTAAIKDLIAAVEVQSGEIASLWSAIDILQTARHE